MIPKGSRATGTTKSTAGKARRPAVKKKPAGSRATGTTKSAAGRARKPATAGTRRGR